MTDLIPRDAAASVCDKHSYSNNPYVSGRMADAAAEIRAIPTIDPAAIRDAALIEAARIIVTHEMGIPMHSPPQLLTEAHDRILALIGEKK